MFYSLTAHRKFAVALLVAGLALLPACGGPAKSQYEVGKKESMEAVALFVVGQVRADGKAIQTGDRVSDGMKITVGNRSVCDLQLLGKAKGMRATIRLRANSELTFDARAYTGAHQLTADVAKGTALFNVDKQDKSGRFRVVTPTTIAGVRGTRFEVKVQPGGASAVNVYEGAVANRQRIPEIEELPESVIAESEALQEVVSGLEQSEQVMTAGQSLQRDPEAGREILESQPELMESVTKGPLSQLRGKEDLTKEQIQSAVNDLNQVYASESKREELKKAVIAPAAAAAPRAEKIADADLQRKIKEYEELIGIDAAEPGVVQDAVKERNKKNQVVLQKRIEKIFNKTSETLILTNGTRITGVVDQVGEDYVVYTTSGKRFLKSAEVEGFEF